MTTLALPEELPVLTPGAWLGACLLYSGRLLSYGAAIGEFNPVGAVLLSIPAGIVAVVVALIVKDKR